jgi:adenylosuccinate lyase
MIDRYARPEMKEIWTDDGRYRRWLEVELAVCEVQAERGLIPRDALDTIRAKAAVDPRSNPRCATT